MYLWRVCVLELCTFALFHAARKQRLKGEKAEPFLKNPKISLLVRATKKNGRARCCFVAQGTTLVLESAITDQPYTASLVFSSCAPCTRVPMSKPIVETCLQGTETISLVVRHLRTIPFFPICRTNRGDSLRPIRAR